jgi:hypothetical protein
VYWVIKHSIQVYNPFVTSLQHSTLGTKQAVPWTCSSSAILRSMSVLSPWKSHHTWRAQLLSAPPHLACSAAQCTTTPRVLSCSVHHHTWRAQLLSAPPHLACSAAQRTTAHEWFHAHECTHAGEWIHALLGLCSVCVCVCVCVYTLFWDCVLCVCVCVCVCVHALLGLCWLPLGLRGLAQSADSQTRSH